MYKRVFAHRFYDGGEQLVLQLLINVESPTANVESATETRVYAHQKTCFRPPKNVFSPTARNRKSFNYKVFRPLFCLVTYGNTSVNLINAHIHEMVTLKDGVQNSELRTR